jgi:hypothetical protein
VKLARGYLGRHAVLPLSNPIQGTSNVAEGHEGSRGQVGTLARGHGDKGDK